MNTTNDTNTNSNPTNPSTEPKQLRKVRKAMRKSSFATLATTSPAGRSHVAGVVYDEADGVLWIHTMRSSRKARSIAANPHVGVCIPFRKLPAGPPYTLHFQARAELVDMDSAEVAELLERKALKGTSGHGALEMDDGVFVKVVPNGTVHTYGLGTNPIELIRDPLNTGADSVRLDAA